MVLILLYQFLFRKVYYIQERHPQEVQEVFKDGHEDFAGITEKGEYLGADYVQFIAPLMKAVQELSEKVESQQKEIEELKGK